MGSRNLDWKQLLPNVLVFVEMWPLQESRNFFSYGCWFITAEVIPQGLCSTDRASGRQLTVMGLTLQSACSTNRDLSLPAEVNTISEHTETLHLNPHITTDLVSQGVEKTQEVCTHSCEELSSMMNELSGLHVMVNQLSKNLEKVVGAWWRGEVASKGGENMVVCQGCLRGQPSLELH